MILKEYEIEGLLNKNNLPACMLIFGPNEGLIRENILNISNKFKINDDADEISINGKNLDDNPEFLLDEVNTFSMFNKKKVIHIENIKDKHLNFIETLNLKDLKNILIIIKSENLKKNSKLRNFFEKSESCLSVACYEDDTRSIMKLIQKFQSKNKLVFNSDVKNYLIQNLSDDRLVSNNELEKILLISNLDSKFDIKLEDIQSILNDGSSNTINKVIQNIMYGKINSTSKTIKKILDEGINSVTLIRSLINYLLRIHQTQIELKKKNNFDEAIKSLKPPIFWKDKDHFKNHCTKWPARSISKCVSTLVEAEYKCKSESELSNEFCENYILTIAQQGHNYFK